MSRHDGGKSTISYHASATRSEVRVAERVWDPASTPVAGLVIIHGGSSHSGWFGELGDLLSSPEHSIRVSALDLPAHGLSDDVVPGLRTYVPDFAEHASDASLAVTRAHAALPSGVPVFLLGESMGGLIALMALLDHADVRVDGLVLCGALVVVAPGILPPRAMMPLIRLMAWLFPTIAAPGQDIGGDTFDAAFADPDAGAEARADPLVCEKAPARVGPGVGALTAMNRVVVEAAEKVKVESVLMMHYKGDGRALCEPTKELVDGLEHVDDKVVVLLEGDAHQLFQDTKEKSKEHAETVARFIVERAVPRVPS